MGRTVFALLLAGLAASNPLAAAQAQTAPEPVVQFFSYRLSDKAAFEEGYRHHLAWHADNQDPLSWFAWDVVSGDRLDLFIDGTVATLAALDQRRNLAEDGYDFQRTAARFATPQSIEIWTHWPIAGSVRFPMVPVGTQADVFHIQVKPAQAKAFESATSRLAPNTNPAHPITWLKLSRGAPAPSYLLFIQRGKAADIDSIGHDFAGVLRTLFKADQQGIDAILGTIESLKVETWRYLPRSSLIAGQPLAK